MAEISSLLDILFPGGGLFLYSQPDILAFWGLQPACQGKSCCCLSAELHVLDYKWMSFEFVQQEAQALISENPVGHLKDAHIRGSSLLVM